MKYYHIYFTGEGLDNISVDQLKINLSVLFKTDLSRIDKMFMGKPVIIKKHIDEEKAALYKKALLKAGAKIIIKEVLATQTAANQKVELARLLQPPKTPNPSPTSSAMSSGLAGLINYNQSSDNKEQQESETDSGWKLVPLNTGSLEEYSEQSEDFELPDLSDYSMSEAGQGSLQEYAPKVIPAEIRDSSYMDITDKNNRPLSDQIEKVPAIELPNIEKIKMSEAQTGSLVEFIEDIEPFDLDSITDIQLENKG